jgi:hypothetical protein
MVQDNHFNKAVANLFLFGFRQNIPLGRDFLFPWYTGCMKLFKHMVFNNNLFRLGLVFLLIIVLLETAAETFNWYYIFPNFDTPMHILGGILVGFVALSYTPRHYNVLQKLLWVIAWSIIIGGAVEIIEWALDHIFHLEIAFLMQPNNWDTITDILHDFIGGILAYCYAYFMRRL